MGKQLQLARTNVSQLGQPGKQLRGMPGTLFLRLPPPVPHPRMVEWRLPSGAAQPKGKSWGQCVWVASEG